MVNNVWEGMLLSHPGLAWEHWGAAEAIVQDYMNLYFAFDLYLEP